MAVVVPLGVPDMAEVTKEVDVGEGVVVGEEVCSMR